jgi:hypothetical protein
MVASQAAIGFGGIQGSLQIVRHGDDRKQDES